MYHPFLGGYEVEAVARADADVRHRELDGFFTLHLAALSLSRGAQQEAACRAALDVAVSKGGGVGEFAVVEGVVAIDVQGLHRQHVFGQRDALLSLAVEPAIEVMGVLVGDVEAEALAVQFEVQLIVIVAPQYLCGVEREVERDSQIAYAQRECRLVVGIHL